MRLVLLLMLTLVLPACSIPRAVGMHIVGKNEIPVIPDAESPRRQVDGGVTSPSFTLQFNSPRSLAETADWYVQHFDSRGWTIEKVPNRSIVVWDLPKDEDDKEATYRAVRKKWPLSKEVAIVEESIILKLRDGDPSAGEDQPIRVYIYLQGKYAWDFPSDALHQVFYLLAYISPLRPSPVYDGIVNTLEFVF